MEKNRLFPISAGVMWKKIGFCPIMIEKIPLYHVMVEKIPLFMANREKRGKISTDLIIGKKKHICHVRSDDYFERDIPEDLVEAIKKVCEPGIKCIYRKPDGGELGCS